MMRRQSTNRAISLLTVAAMLLSYGSTAAFGAGDGDAGDGGGGGERKVTLDFKNGSGSEGSVIKYGESATLVGTVGASGESSVTATFAIKNGDELAKDTTATEADNTFTAEYELDYAKFPVKSDAYEVTVGFSGLEDMNNASAEKSFTVTAGQPTMTLKAEKEDSAAIAAEPVTVKKGDKIKLTAELTLPVKNDGDTFPSSVTFTPTAGTVTKAENGTKATYTAEYTVTGDETGEISFSTSVEAWGNFAAANATSENKFKVESAPELTGTTTTIESVKSNGKTSGFTTEDDLTVNVKVSEKTKSTETGPIGTVTIKDGDNEITGKSAEVTALDTAVEINIGKLNAGEHSLTAVFTPADGSDYATSTSEPSKVTVTAAPTQTAIEIDTVEFNAKTYDGTDAVSVKNITFKAATGSTLTAQPENTDYNVEAKLTSGVDVGDSKPVTVTVALTDAGKAKYTLSNATKSDATINIGKAAYNGTIPAATKSVTLGNSSQQSITVSNELKLTPAEPMTAGTTSYELKAGQTYSKIENVALTSGTLTFNVKDGATAGKDTITITIKSVNFNDVDATLTVDVVDTSVAPDASVVEIDYAGEKITYDAIYEVFADNKGETAISTGSSITNYIGKTIYVRSKDGNQYTSVSIPARPAKPEKVEAKTVTDKTVVLKAITGAEYKYNSEDWQDSTTFGSLTSGTEYTFHARIKATESAFASEIAESESIRTKAAAVEVTDVIAEGTYGQKLSEFAFTATITDNIAGTWSFADKDQNIIPNVGGETSYVVTFTPSDTDKYEVTTATVVPTVKQKNVTVQSATAKGRVYDGTKDVEITGITFAETGLELVMGTDYTASGSMADANAGDSKNVTVTIEGLNKNYNFTGSPTATVNIEKAPADVVPATSTLNVKVGATGKVESEAFKLNVGESSVDGISYEVKVEGTAKVVDTPSITNGVVSASLKSNLTAGDSDTITVTIKSTNYKDATATLTVNVTDKDIPTVDTAVDTSGTIAVGEPLSKLTLSGTFKDEDSKAVAGKLEWKNPDEKPMVAGSYDTTWVFAPGDASNYATVEGSVSINVDKGTPAYTAPTGLTGVYDADLSTVALPSGWAWKNGSATLDTVGEMKFTATYTPSDTTNYNTVDVELTVTVGKADPTLTAPGPFNALINITTTVGGVKIEDKTNDGTWAWKDSTTKLTTGANSCAAVFTPKDTNYNTVEKDIVINAVKVESVTVSSGNNDPIKPNGTLALTATVATTPSGATSSIKWTSSNETVATVDSNGTVTGKKDGVAVVKAFATVNGTDLSTPYGSFTVKVQDTPPADNTEVLDQLLPNTENSVIADIAGKLDNDVKDLPFGEQVKAVADAVVKSNEVENLHAEDLANLNDALQSTNNVDVTLEQDIKETNPELIVPGQVEADNLVLAAASATGTIVVPDEVILQVEQKPSTDAKSNDAALLFDIKLVATTSGQSTEVQNLKVPVRIKIPKIRGIDAVGVLHYHGTTPSFISFIADSDFWTFEVKNFSDFEIVTKKPTPPVVPPISDNTTTNKNSSSSHKSSSSSSSTVQSIRDEWVTRMIRTAKSAKEGEVIRLSPNTKMVYGEVLEAIKGHDVTLVIPTEDGEIVINGMDVDKVSLSVYSLATLRKMFGEVDNEKIEKNKIKFDDEEEDDVSGSYKANPGTGGYIPGVTPANYTVEPAVYEPATWDADGNPVKNREEGAAAVISALADPAAWSDLGGVITPEEVSPVTANAQSFPMALVLVMGLIAAAAAGGIVLLMKSKRQH